MRMFAVWAQHMQIRLHQREAAGRLRLGNRNESFRKSLISGAPLSAGPIRTGSISATEIAKEREREVKFAQVPLDDARRAEREHAKRAPSAIAQLCSCSPRRKHARRPASLSLRRSVGRWKLIREGSSRGTRVIKHKTRQRQSQAARTGQPNCRPSSGLFAVGLRFPRDQSQRIER